MKSLAFSATELVLLAHHGLDFVLGLLRDGEALGLKGDRADGVHAEQPAHRREGRNVDVGVGVSKAAAALFLHHADHGEVLPGDPHRLPERRRFVEEVSGGVGAEHHDPGAAPVLGLREPAPDRHGGAGDGGPILPDSLDVDRVVLAFVFDLDAPVHAGRDEADRLALFLDRFGVVQLQRAFGTHAEADRAAPLAAGNDGEGVGAEPRETLHDGLLATRADGDGDDDRADADDDAEHGEERPELVGPKPSRCHAQADEEHVHRSIFARTRRRRAVRRRMESRPPPWSPPAPPARFRKARSPRRLSNPT